MQFLVFILVYPFIWLWSLLPFRILYFISDCFYYLVYYIIGYRKKTVIYNLTLAFPQKSAREIKAIAKKFYHHFTDVFIEMVKSFTISEKTILKRYTFTNIELLQQLEAKHKSIVLIGSHYANWEWVFCLNLLVNYKGYAVFKKLKNPYFDKKIRETRGRFHTSLIPTKKIFEVVENNANENTLSMYGFLGDQSPKLKKAHHWSTFLGITVPVYTGAEVLAKKHNLAVVSFQTQKIKRGYYQTNFKLLAENPTNFNDYDITDFYLKELEKSIYKAPQYYFWTHKRFKHKGKNQPST